MTKLTSDSIFKMENKILYFNHLSTSNIIYLRVEINKDGL